MAMKKLFKPKNIHLSSEGPAKVLGDLEARVMQYIWQHDTVTVGDVRNGLAIRHKKLSFNAIMTIMNRLVEKGLLKKVKDSDPYRYQPRMSQEHFFDSVTKDILTAVLKDPVLFSAKGFTSFVDELDDAMREKLKHLLKNI